nr:unnamed protein product [Brassica rapa]
MEAAYIPEVNDDLDTQNFEKFDEEDHQTLTPSCRTGPWRKMLSSKDINFVGYTYKNFEIVNDYQVPGIAELKKKETKAKRPSVRSLFESESSESSSDTSQTVVGTEKHTINRCFSNPTSREIERKLRRQESK